MTRFVDTNVLLYAVSTEEGEAQKRGLALEILDDPGLVTSVQVLQEFYVQATHRSRADAIEHGHAVALVESWLRFRVVETSVDLLQAALAASARWRISYWDAAIVEAARLSGCSALLSEDLQSGMNFSGVVVENPFAGVDRV